VKAWKSGVWTLFGQATNIFANLAALAILGRLLTPEEFGIFGIAMAIQSFVLPILDMGLQPAYIKLEKNKADASNAFFTINALAGGAVALLIYSLSAPLAEFYQVDELDELIAFLSVSILFTAIGGQPQAVLTRKKRFDVIVFVNTTTLVSGAIFAVLLAWNGLGIWSLIWRVLYESAARFVLLALFSRQRYRLVGYTRLKPSLRDLSFGLEIVFSRLLNAWVRAIDKLMLSKFASLDVVGVYTRSQQLALMPDANIRTSVTTPALAYLAQKKTTASLEDYLTLYWLIFLIAGTPCLVLTVFGDIILPVLLGDQWSDAGWILQWMGLFGLARVFQGMITFYHVDRKIVKRTSYYVLGSIAGVLMLPIILLVTTSSHYLFIPCLSISAILYWLSALLHTMSRDWHSYQVAAMLIKLALVSVVSSGSILLLKLLFWPVNFTESTVELQYLITGMLCQAALVFSLFAALNTEEMRRFLNLIRK